MFILHLHLPVCFEVIDVETQLIVFTRGDDNVPLTVIVFVV